MTICVATICTNDMVIGAADRMITSGDVQFQPLQPKIWPITTSIAVMVAGDIGVHTLAFQRLQTLVAGAISSNPDRWILVREIADSYERSLSDIKRERAERALLAPLGLTVATFNSGQVQMEPNLVQQLARELIGFKLPEVAALIVGIDETGPHIYSVMNDGMTCHDRAGFASVGAGYWHANSQLMFAGHVPSTNFGRALIMTFSAKRRAEVAPGVGTDTDMFMIGPRPGTYLEIGLDHMRSIADVYQETIALERGLMAESERKLNAYLDSLASAAQRQAATQHQPAQQEPAGNAEAGGSVDSGSTNTDPGASSSP